MAPRMACGAPVGVRRAHALALPGESLAAHMTAVIACACHAPLPRTLTTHARPGHLVDHPLQAAMVRRGLQTQGEWAAVRRQPIYFVPPKLAATMPQLVKGRRSAEQYDAVKQVHDEIERFQTRHAADGFA